MKFRVLLLVCFLFMLPGVLAAQVRRAEYLQLIKRAADEGWQGLPASIAAWKKNPNHHELWGYDSPGNPIYLADLLGYLYQETHEKIYAERARDILSSFGDLRETYPREFAMNRIEYRNGVPAISNFFIMPPYSRAYTRIRESGLISGTQREKIERDLAFSLDHTFYFPEWGAHNRAMLRAESLYYGALAIPGHPNAGKWKQLAETLASDSLRQWEIEDATGYHSIWLYSVFSYVDASGQEDVLRSPMIKYYLDYFVQLLTPHGNVVDFGDAHWNEGNTLRFVPVYEKAARLYRNPEYKYFAEQLMRRAMERMSAAQKVPVSTVNIGTGNGSALTDACRWTDDTVGAQAPTNLSGDVLEDMIGKKFVFRDGWQRTSTMLMLNYRDEGDGGWLARDYLRQNLSVEEEKMHHGHADENSIALLMSGGSVLLHDGGYRPALPSGPNGEWRADYYHNRVVARKNKPARDQQFFEFVRNSGAYRRVRTQRIDFQKFRDVDYSRSRVIDEDMGYQSDRIVTWVRDENYFVVVDAIKALRSDWFTFSNMWHTRQIVTQDSVSFDTFYDQIRDDQLPRDMALLISFPERGFGKQIGTFKETRHFQDETAMYQTVSSFYKTGDTEYFVTILIPHPQGEDARTRLNRFRILGTDRPGRTIGVEVQNGSRRDVVCVKLDLDMDLARENIRPRYNYELGKAGYGDFETDASFLFARVDESRVSYSAATMTRIVYRGQNIMEALPNTFGLQLDGSPARSGFARWRKWEDVVNIRR